MGLLFNPYVLIAIAVFFFSSLFGAFRFGEHTCEGLHARADLEQKITNDADAAKRRAVADAAKAASDQRVADLERKFLTEKAAHKADVDAVKQRIPANVTPLADARCVVPAGFVGLWNESVRDPHATGGPAAAPGAASLDPNRASGVALSTVIDAAVDNHANFWDLKQQLDALNAWGDEVEALYAKLKANAKK